MIFKNAIKSGALWIYFDYITSFILQAIGLIILSRIILPEFFGIFAIGLIITGFTENTFRAGFGQAIVQMKSDPKEYVNTLWVANLSLGVMSTLIMYFLAPFILLYLFRSSNSEPYVLLMLSVTLFHSLMNPTIALKVREFDQKTLFFINLFNPLVRYTSTIIIALFYADPFSLACGYVLGATASTAASFIFIKDRPSFDFDLNKFKELYSFSGWIQLNGIFRWASKNLDSIVVGNFVGKEGLGLYNRAIAISSMPIQPFNILLGRLLFPALSRLNDRPTSQDTLLYHSFNFFIVFSFTITLIFLFLGESIVWFLLGPNWSDLNSFLFILATAYLIKLLLTLSCSFFRAIGHTKIEFNLNLIQIGISTLLLPLCVSKFALEGAAIAILISSLITLLPLTYWLVKFSNLNLFKYCRNLFLALVSLLISILVIQVSDTYLSYFNSSFIKTTISLLIFYFFLYLLNLGRNDGPISSIHTIYKNLTH